MGLKQKYPVAIRPRQVKRTVKEFASGDQGKRIYSVEAVSVENGVSPVPEMADADRANGSRLLAGPTGLLAIVAQQILEFNRNGSSKAVAPDAGEPLVVYHGTAADF